MHILSTLKLLVLCNFLYDFCSLAASDKPIKRTVQNQYAQQQASIRIGSDLCAEEQNYLTKRLPKVKETLQNLLGMQLNDNQVPRIALCASGGGYRAMISTLGWMQGTEITKRSFSSMFNYLNPKSLFSSITNYFYNALGYGAGEDLNTFEDKLFGPLPLSLLDATTYCAALSGSTWAVASLYQSRMPINDLLEHMVPYVSKAFLSGINYDYMMGQLLKKEELGQPTSFIDIYGNILAQKLLADLGTQNPSAIDIVAYKNVVDQAQMPLPISTAVIGEGVVTYEWVEFTPYEVGSTFLKSFIPSWAFGRKFENSKSIDFTPPFSLGYCMGIWGSAMSVSAQEVFDYIEPEVQNGALLDAAHIFDKIKESIEPTELAELGDDVAEKRVSPAQVYNWGYFKRGAQGLPLTQEKTLTLVDGGHDFNLPFPPLLRNERAVDIIIVLDASSGQIAGELQKAEQYARTRGLKFPTIDYSKVGNICSVHTDADPAVPIVIYMPLVKNSNYQNGWDPTTAAFTDTMNLKYSRNQIFLLSGLTQQNMLESQQTILQVIKNWIATRS
jgi:phospholipase A2